MKLLLTLLTGISLSASLPALADTTPNGSASVQDRGPDRGHRGDHRGDHRGPGWDHGGWRHHRHHCGPFGRFWCDVNGDQIAE